MHDRHALISTSSISSHREAAVEPVAVYLFTRKCDALLSLSTLDAAPPTPSIFSTFCLLRAACRSVRARVLGSGGRIAVQHTRIACARPRTTGLIALLTAAVLRSPSPSAGLSLCEDYPSSVQSGGHEAGLYPPGTAWALVIAATAEINIKCLRLADARRPPRRIAKPFTTQACSSTTQGSGSLHTAP